MGRPTSLALYTPRAFRFSTTACSLAGWSASWLALAEQGLVARALPFFLLALLLGSPVARADSPKQPDTAPVTSSSEDDEDKKPYIEGWHGGSPPGEHVIARADLWYLSMQRTLLEVGHLQHTHAATTEELGEPSTGASGGLGLEVFFGKSGWTSVDWWTLQSQGIKTLAQSETMDEVQFPEGSLVTSQVTQQFVKVRDGLDIRYRVPLGDETWLDWNFGPVTALVVRYESYSIKTLGGGPESSDSLLAVSLTPGWCTGADLHVADGFIVRAGFDGEALPHLPYNWLSFTRAPSISAWADVRAYLALRFECIEASFGWRYFRTLASGGRFRQAYSEMSGVFGEVAARF
jgi:hypothetical protein